MSLVLRILGRFELVAVAGSPVDIKGARAQVLLARLALSAGMPVDRSFLSAMLWGDRADAQARASLRQSIWSIRQALNQYPTALIVEGATVRLDRHVVQTDVAEFDRLAGSTDLADLDRALTIYRGDLLDGIDVSTLAADGFILQERSRLRDRALETVNIIVREYTRNDQPEKALRAARTGMMLDPYDETRHATLIDLLRKSGRHKEAQEQAVAFRNLMQDELGIALPPTDPVGQARSARVRELPAPPPLQSLPAMPTAKPDGGRGRFRQIIAGLAATSIILTAGVVARRDAPDAEIASGGAANGLPSVLVTPFQDTSADHDQPEHASALTAGLATDLSRVSGLIVMSNQQDTADLTDPDAAAAARRLGIAHVLTGSTRRSEDMIWIDVRLIDAVTGEYLWGANFDRSIDALFQVQDEVVREIVDALDVQLQETEMAAIARIPTTNLEAYDQYMRAEEQRLISNEADQLRRVMAAYGRAIELDPGFAEAHAGYARAAEKIWRQSFGGVMPGTVARQEAYAAAGRALTLDPGNARAYVVLSQIQASDGAHDSALTSARRAVALQPNDAEAHGNLALILSYAGEYAQATAEMEATRRLDPTLSPELLVFSGQVAFADARYDDAVDDFLAAWPQLSGNETMLEHLSASLALQGRIPEARANSEKILALVPAANLELYRALNAKARTDEQNERFLDGLRIAGIPPWPYGFEGRAEDRVFGAELAAMAGRSNWVGHLGDGRDFWQQTTADGSFAYRTETTLLSGMQFVQDGQICQVIAGYRIGGEICGFVYRTDPATSDGTQFVFISLDEAKYFNLEK